MRQLRILLRKDLLELMRTKRALIVGIIFVVFALMSPLLAKVTPELLKMLEDQIQITMPEATAVDSYSQFVKNVSGMCAYVLIIVFAGLIVNERKSGMFNNLLNNGVNRWTFVLSKWLAQVLVVTGIYVVSVILFFVCNWALFEQFLTGESLLSFLMMYVFLIFVLSFIDLFSVIAKSMVMSIVLGFLMIFLIAIFDLFEFGRYLPNHLISLSAGIFNDGTLMDYVWPNIGITLGLSAGMVLTAMGLCGNKE